MDADVLRAMLASGELLCRLRDEGWVQHRDGFVVRLTGLPVPSLNGVVCWDPDADVESVMSALDDVAREDVPHALLLAPGSVALAAAADAAGLERADDARLMRFDAEPDAALPRGLRTRLAATSEMDTHVRLAADGFEAPVEVFQALADTVSGQQEVITMLGEIEAEPVTTAQGLVQGESVGVFSVATPPAPGGTGSPAGQNARMRRRRRAHRSASVVENTSTRALEAPSLERRGSGEAEKP